ncbi:magnesium transporter [Alishewanella sp. 16-MA]|uniref:Magnesium transporter MgtE n=1 Tax=Alishewanella maricola TaxID=2795740 RepID=A0ABS8BYU5_9ALTE|nr:MULTISPECIES: magnesium transporter [Gammaproteobacteria]MDP5036290.1 magnesium transporter [Alishewanella sp.]MDP5206267.1 magnesium transporter [Alishewanella sp. SMS9]MCB5225239.1 magnesium transporter [Alishewanella maricola]MCC5450815.1 magnesium transporter [Rheinheimera sp. UJ51]MCF4008512.1 magnesium transporter [Rheinheimera sp. UJ63]
MDLPVLIKTLRNALQHDTLPLLREQLEDVHPADYAAALTEFSATELWSLLTVLPRAEQAEVFGYLPAEVQVSLAISVSRRKLSPIIRQMSSDERADLFNQLSDEQRDTLLPALAQAEREDLLRLSAHEEGSAGAIMTSDYALLPPELTVREAIEVLRLEAPDKETIYSSYVVDEARKLIGVVSLRDLILAPVSMRVDDLMNTDPIFASVELPQEEIASLIAKYDLLALPIVNSEHQMVGIVTYDDAMDVAAEEATEDFHKTATIGKLDGNVKNAGIGLLYRKRVFWLVVLVFGNIFSGAGIAYFEETIARYIALLFFLPLLIASSGNAGAQAGTLMVRALATGEIKLRDWGYLLGKECLVAGLLGLTMSAAVLGLGLWRGGADIAIVVSCTMMLVVMAGSLIGLSLPFLLSRFNLDPATASGPLITSIADVTGVVVYFSIATWYLGL